MNKMQRRIKSAITPIALAALCMWVSAGDTAHGAESQQTTKEVKQAANEFDFGKRIVYSVDGMAKVMKTRDIVYKTEDGAKLLMDVYVPPKLASDVRLPVVFFVHGGPILADAMPPKDWGTYQSYGELAAASGFVGVTFNRRLFSNNDYGRSQSDVAAAIEYVRSHANELHVDVNRIALWIYSGGGPHLSWVLRERPAGLRCAVAFYSRLDLRSFLPPNADVKVVAAVERLSAAAQVKEYGANLPIFIARAGLDVPQLNQGIDRFVSEALAGNLDIEVMNHSHGRHGFDVIDDNDRSREIIARAVAFLQSHLGSK